MSSRCSPGEPAERAVRHRGPNATRRRVRAVVRRLDSAYGPLEAKPPLDPLDGLVMTVLSQATNDRNSSLAFERLTTRFPTWGEVIAAPVGELEAAIRPGGLSRTKARVIRAILEELRSRPEGFLSLRRLGEASIDAAMAELTALPGVGLKTAACVLLFDFGRPVLPVDTHVHRLARRLCLVAERATADQAQAVLMAITPADLVYRLHVWLIAHGRAVCRSQRPRCDACVLADLCPAAAATTS
jgi:endonuclease III